MIHLKSTCMSCNKETHYVRTINVGNHSITLCNDCGIKLVTNKTLELNKRLKLNITKKHGDFYNVEIEVIQEDYWERVKASRLLSQMDNQSPLDSCNHQSY